MFYFDLPSCEFYDNGFCHHIKIGCNYCSNIDCDLKHGTKEQEEYLKLKREKLNQRQLDRLRKLKPKYEEIFLK